MSASSQATRASRPTRSLTTLSNRRNGASFRSFSSASRTSDGRRSRRTGNLRAPLNEGIVAQAGAGVEDSAAELARLREENAKLRALAAVAVENLEPEKRSAFIEEHRKLQAAAKALGEDVPAIVPGEEPQQKPEAVVEQVTPVPEPVKQAAKVEAPSNGDRIVMEDGGVSAVVEIERDTLVFKFGPASADAPSPVVSNNSDNASAMSVDPSKAKKSSKSRSIKSSASTGDSESTPITKNAIVEEDAGTVTFRFTTDSSSASTPSPAAKAATPAAAVDADSSKTTEEAETPKKRTPRARSSTTTGSARRKTPAAAKAVKSEDAVSSGAAATTPKKSTAGKKADPFAAAKAAASKEATSHDPQAIVAGRENWLYFTVPEVPVAGADCVVYYNKAQSEPLRSAGKLQIHPRFNNWEVNPDDGDSSELQPASIARAEGVDFYSATIHIPEDAYEMNFIFSDGEAHFDNNYQQNYLKEVHGAMTKELWLDAAPERAEAAYLKRKAEEAAAAAKAEAERKAAAEAKDAEDAQNAVGELKHAYDGWRNGAVKEQIGYDGKTLWKLKGDAVAGKKATLLYNRAAGPFGSFEVPEDQNLALKVGYNGWKGTTDVTLKRTKVAGATQGDDWWEGSLDVAPDAAVLNFVVNYYEHYDNNNGSDHNILVDLPAGVKSVESWADSMLSTIRANIQSTREAAEAKEAEKQRKRAESRQAARDRAMDVRRAQMRHVLFTEPEVIQAGKPFTLYYNPNNTSLAGRERVWVRGSYNRWKHPKTYGPIELTAPTTGEHFSTTINVPKDAFSVDVVFSDMEEGGTFDNRGGLDYNFPVQGSVVHEPQLHVAHIAVEMAPICKVGGLGDVVTALGRAVQEQGHLVEVILPRYDFFLQSPLLGATQYETEFDYNGVRVFVSTCVVEGLRCFFIEPSNGTFATSTVYQGASDAGRFEYFSRLALEFLLQSGRQPDILHCHDWSTADVAKFYWNEWHHYGLWKPKVVFTIHNLNYGQAKLGEAAYFSQKFTTVSPSYAWEIGGNPILAANNGKLMGIRNGIDIDIWDPETDQFLPKHYTADNVVEGKAAAREELRRRLGLTGWGDKPMVGVVTRLTKQKGTHLIAHACYRTIDRGGQYVLLGSAPDPKVQAEFDALASQYGGENAAFCFAFDEPLSHLIYAACDFILVPSMFEPCGLTQMIAMRFGAIPIVRATGGLKDTVFDVDTDKARAAWELLGSTNPEDGSEAVNGFAFEGTDEGSMDYAMNRAFDAWYNDREWIHKMQERVMRQDWSWNKPAYDYIELYWNCLK